MKIGKKQRKNRSANNQCESKLSGFGGHVKQKGIFYTGDHFFKASVGLTPDKERPEKDNDQRVGIAGKCAAEGKHSQPLRTEQETQKAGD
ncbi:hypothetical protein SDC9_182208 [bioreactor metagenome]|uniref:Uncharacterized protein n=1 Tax=bioreactor metagenome TaxID=1076179 RepID=A0A645HF46_9ZZZZ